MTELALIITMVVKIMHLISSIISNMQQANDMHNNN